MPNLRRCCFDEERSGVISSVSFAAPLAVNDGVSNLEMGMSDEHDSVSLCCQWSITLLYETTTEPEI